MLKSEFNLFLRTQLEDIRDKLVAGDFDKDFNDSIKELEKTSNSGQSEYALSQDAFDNFNRLGDELNMSREKVLFVYMKKHLDGIVSYLKGHRSQREPVQGRIKDVIVYSLLLWAMVNEEENEKLEEAETIEL